MNFLGHQRMYKLSLRIGGGAHVRRGGDLWRILAVTPAAGEQEEKT